MNAGAPAGMNASTNAPVVTWGPAPLAAGARRLGDSRSVEPARHDREHERHGGRSDAGDQATPPGVGAGQRHEPALGVHEGDQLPPPRCRGRGVRFQGRWARGREVVAGIGHRCPSSVSVGWGRASAARS